MKLKPTARPVKQIEKETVEQIELKPTKAVVEPAAVQLEPVSDEKTKVLEEEVKKSGKVTKVIKVKKSDDQSSPDVEKASDTGVTVTTKDEDKPVRRGSKQLPVQDGPKPWTQEQVKLKPTVRPVKQIEKETVEQVELKPSKEQASVEVAPLEMGDVIPKPKEEIKKVTKVIKVKKSDEPIEQVSEHLEQKPEQDKPVRRGSKQLPVVDEPKPWNQEQIKLKPATRPLKQIEKETVEQVELKPTKPMVVKTEPEITQETTDETKVKPKVKVVELDVVTIEQEKPEVKQDEQKSVQDQFGVTKVEDIPTPVPTTVKKRIKTIKAKVSPDDSTSETVEPIEKVLQACLKMQSFCFEI